MATNPKPRIRFVPTKTGTLTKIAVVTTILLSAAALITLRMTQWDLQDRAEELRQEAGALEQRTSCLLASIDRLGTVDGIREIARNQLGLVDPDTILFENNK